MREITHTHTHTHTGTYAHRNVPGTCRNQGLAQVIRYLFWPQEGFPCGSASKESACNVGDLGSIPGLGRSPGGGNSYPLQYSGLENFMDCIIHGVTKSWTGLSDFHFTWSQEPLTGWLV